MPHARPDRALAPKRNSHILCITKFGCVKRGRLEETRVNNDEESAYSIAVVRYGSGAMAFHWIMVLLLVVVGALGLMHDSWPKRTQSYWINVHAILGLLLWMTLIARFWWRMQHAPPILPVEVGRAFATAFNSGTPGAVCIDVRHADCGCGNFYLARPDFRFWIVSDQFRHPIKSDDIRADRRYAWVPGICNLCSRGDSHFGGPVAPVHIA